MSALHECPHPDCTESTPITMFACRRHWFALPLAIRNGINSAWRRIRNGDPSGIDAHRAATDEAMAWWTR